MTLVFYALDAHIRGGASLDPKTAFTAIAIITLVTSPAVDLLAMVPNVAQVYGCAVRVQKYLLEPSRVDQRVLMMPHTGESGTNGPNSNLTTDPTLAMILEDLVLRPASSADVCLDGISLQVKKGSLNVICGAVGTGKTTLARAILGDGFTVTL